MTLQEILTVIVKKEKPDFNVEIYGNWEGTADKLEDLQIPVNTVIYERENGIRIFLGGKDNGETEGI